MKSIEKNGVGFNTICLDINWGRVAGELTTVLRTIDVILASDCFYEKEDFDDVLFTIALLLNSYPKAECWCSQQRRW